MRGPILGILCIASIVTSRKIKMGIGPLSYRVSTARAEGLWPQRSRACRLDFISPRNVCRFLEHGRDRAILVLAELNGVLHGPIVELAAEAVHDLQLLPDGRRLRSTLPRAGHFQRLQLLPLLPEDAHDVRRGASPQGH